MTAPTLPPTWEAHARTAVRDLRSSAIREIANNAMNLPNVLPFWFGEPDSTTPQEIRTAAIHAINSGDVFYTPTLGRPHLRDAIAEYSNRLRGRGSRDEIAVTSSGTSALMTAINAIVAPGDRVVAVSPIWPNLVEIPKVLEARVETVSLDFTSTGWNLDIDMLLSALTPGTRAVLINSPNNPTGWVLPAADQTRILEHCRLHGIWIVSDDVYERYYFNGAQAPTFLDIAQPDDRVISCNSFSKTWLMTGWRLGWIVAPKGLIPPIGKLIEFSTTCAPGFVQEAAFKALEVGEPYIAATVARLKSARDHLDSGLSSLEGVDVATAAPGAMYTFFKVTSPLGSIDLCRDIISKTGLGLAPGAAFGEEGEGFLRWCFASDTARIDAGLNRLHDYLSGSAR